MSKNERSTGQKHAGRRGQSAPQQRAPDQRVRHTRERLGSALIDLLAHTSINDVTVQQVLNRASVGRSTFYLHYRDKYDLLLSQLERFLETVSTMLSMRKEKSDRVVPVAELFAHIGNQNRLYRMLADTGHLHDFFDLAEGYFARGIKRRLTESKRLPNLPERELRARSAALAGSLLSLLRWWLNRGEKESPRVMDQLFHRMVWNGLR